MTNLFLSVLEVSVSASVIILALLLSAPFLNRRYSAKWRYRIWIFLALWLVFPFYGVQMLSDTLTQRLQSVQDTGSSIQAAQDQTVLQQRIVFRIPEQMTAPLAVQKERDKMPVTLLDIAAAVWMAGSGMFLLIHLASYVHYKHRLMKSSTAIHAAAILSQVEELKALLHIRRTVTLRRSGIAESPMVIGFLHPVLILPDEPYSPKELYFILKHELVHFKRMDVWAKLLFTAANAIHWYHPLVFILVKEAVIDMEISCDEKVVEKAGRDERRAYTETLFSTLNRQCARKNTWSTQFYGGVKIMKKRFQSILGKTKKKNGMFLFLCVLALTVCMGTAVGCSISDTETAHEKEAKNEAKNEEKNGSRQENAAEDVPDNAGDSQSAGSGTDTNITDNSSRQDIGAQPTIIVTKEGITEQKPAYLALGNGFSFYLTQGEWKQDDIEKWTSIRNPNVSIWFSSYHGQTGDELEKLLLDGGYTKDGDRFQKQDGDILTWAQPKDFSSSGKNLLWCIFYCCPKEAEEGFGSELAAIADTFAATENAGDAFLGSKDQDKVRQAVEDFAGCYFKGDAKGIQAYLADSFNGSADTYSGNATVSDFTIKGFYTTDQPVKEDSVYTVSLQYKESTTPDMFMYLTFGFVRQDGDWKIQWYGQEG